MGTLQRVIQKKQREALNALDEYPVLFYGGAKGGGKSYLVRAYQVMRRLTYPGSSGLIVRKSFPELLSNHIRPFFREYPMFVKYYNKSEKTLYFPNGSTTEFSHLSSTDDVYTYQGREYDDISIDEITQHEEEVFKTLRTSLRTTNPDIKPRFLLTGNPGGIGHSWVKRIFIDKDFTPNERPSDYGFVQAKVTDNPSLVKADPDYMERLKDLPDDKRRAYLEGDWSVFSGQVFSEFRYTKHTSESIIPKEDYTSYLSLDWGYSAPFAGYCHSLIDMKTEDGKHFKRLITWQEWYGREKTPSDWAIDIYRDLGKRPVARCYPDPSMLNRKADGSRPIIDEFRETWFHESEGEWVVPIEGGSRDRLKRIALTHAWLSDAPDGIPYWIITSNCRNLIRTLPTLVYDEHKVEDLDSSLEDHAWDSVSYLLGSLRYTPVPMGQFNKGVGSRPIIQSAQGLDEYGETLVDPSAWEA
mgnify:CR=1 FL=1